MGSVNRNLFCRPTYLMVTLVFVLALAVMPSSGLAAQSQSSDTSLGSLTVEPKGAITIVPNSTTYEIGVAYTVTQATVTATAGHAAASVTYAGTDQDDIMSGYQRNLSPSRNVVAVLVTA